MVLWGAGGTEGRGAIQVLLKLVNAGGGKGGAGERQHQGKEGGNADSGEEAEEGRAQGKGRKRGGAGRQQPLRRPLIAICNDLYAPALRPLRAAAKIVHFKRPSVRPVPSGSPLNGQPSLSRPRGRQASVARIPLCARMWCSRTQFLPAVGMHAPQGRGVKQHARSQGCEARQPC